MVVDFIHILRTMIKFDRKKIFITLFGFVIVSLFISQLFISTNSYRNAIYRNFVLSDSTYYSTGFSTILPCSDYFFSNNDSFKDYPNPSNFQNSLLSIINSEELTDKLSFVSTSFGLGFFQIINTSSSISSSNVYFYIVSDDIFNHISNFAYWKKNNCNLTEGVLLFVNTQEFDDSLSTYSPTPYTLLLNETFITIQSIWNEFNQSTPITLDFTHKAIVEQNSETEIDEIYRHVFSGGLRSGIVITEYLFRILLASLDFSPSINSKEITMVSRLNWNLEKLEFTEDESLQLKSLRYSIKETIPLLYPLILEINILSSWELEANLDTFPIILFLSNIPIFFLSFFLIDYICENLNPKRKELITLLQLRGASRKQFFTAELLIFLMITILAFFIGFLSAIPLTNFLFKSKAFLVFTDKTEINFTSNILLNSALLFFFSMVIIYIPKLIKTSKEIKSKTNLAINSKRQKVPFWKKIYLDVIFFIVGLGGVIFIIIIDPSKEPIYNTTTDQGILFLFSYLLCFPLLIIGFVLLIQRIIYPILNKVSRRIWRKRGNLASFSARNIVSKYKLMIKSITIITISVSFLILFMSIPFTNNNIQQTSAGYVVGADARINLSTEYNYSAITEKLPSTIKYTKIQKIDYYYNKKNSGILTLYLLNTTNYASVIYSNSRHLGLGLITAMNLLNTTNSCLIEKRGADLLGLAKDAIYTITTINQSISHNLIIKDFFNSWPFLSERSIVQEDFTTGSPLKMIISFENGEFLVKDSQEFSLKSYILLNLADYTGDSFELQTQFELIDGVEKLVLKEEVFNDLLSNAKTFLTTSHANVNFLLSLISIIVVLLMYSFNIYTNRRKEIGIFLSIGADFKQLIRLYFVESLFLILLGVLFGSIIGFLASMFNIYYQMMLFPESFFPSINLYLIFVIATIGSFIVLTSFVVILPLQIIRNYDTEKLIKNA